MPEVLVDINGRTHSISCSEGEEERVEYLSSLIGKEVSEIAGRVGQVGDIRLILLAAITVLDKSQELIDEATVQIDKSASEMGKIIEQLSDKRTNE